MKARLFSLLSFMMVLALLVPGGARPTAAQLQSTSPGAPPLTVTGFPGSAVNAVVPVDAENVEFVGHIGGVTKAVAVQGDYAYIGEGPALTVLDISDPASPAVVGKTLPLPDLVLDVAVAGGYAYVADGWDTGLRVVDVSMPANPTEVGFYDTPGSAYGVAVAGSYAYVADGGAGLRVLDVSTPSSPTEAGFYDTPYAVDVAVAGSYAYIVGGYAGLWVVDVSTPANPTEVGFYDTPGVAYGVAVAGGYAYVADGEDGGLRVVDVSTPANPTEVGFYDTPGDAYGVAVAGGYAYVADGYSLRVVDVSTPSNPTEVGFYDTPGGAGGVAVAGNYAYVAAAYALCIISIADPTAPSEISSYDTPGPAYATSVAVAGNYAYVAAGHSGLRIINVADPAAPTEAGFYDTPGSAKDVVVVGNYAYVADEMGGLRIIDVADPAAPTETGFYEPLGGAYAVAVAGDYAYICHRFSDDMSIINVADPTNPSRTGFYEGVVRDVTVAGNYAYAAAWSLRIINVANPADPTEVGFYDAFWGLAQGVAVVGNYAYIVAGCGGGLRIINVANPTDPTEVGFYETPGCAYGVALADNYAYVADGYGGLRIINVAAPTAPTEVGFYDTPGYAEGVAVAGGYAYVADGDAGLIILRYTGGGPTYSISGHVCDGSSNPISGVAVSVGSSGSATTDTSGAYTITGLVTGTYTLTPSKSGYTFSPASRTVSVPPDATGQDFTATPSSVPTYSISGHVRDGSSNPISGVTVSAGSSGSATTDASGAYTITGLVTGAYTLTPSKSGYSFSPASRTVSVPPDAMGQDFTASESGSDIDIGFRPNPDGYGFPNWGASPQNADDFQHEDLIRMFGQDAVCRMVGSLCVVKPAAQRWREQVNQYMNGGHCDGFTTTGLRFFKELDNLVDFQADASTTHDLQLANIRRHIAYYWVLQVPNPVATARGQALQKPPNQVLDQLRSAMSDGASDPTTLIVYNAARTSGHSVTPYAIEDKGNGVYWIRVYDNNHSDDADRYVEVNADNNTWSYNLGWMTWSGDASSHTLGAIPISTYAQQPECPWCSGAGTLSGSQLGQVWLDGQGHLLITDSGGQRIGYTGDLFVNEVPGASGTVPPGGLGLSAEPIYTLPLTETYTILLDGQTLTQTETVSVTQFGPGYAVSVDGVTLEQSSQDQLTIALTGTQLAYQASDGKEATLTLALDDTSQSNQLRISGADIGAGQVVTLTADVDNGKLLFNNAQTGGGEYDLEIKRVSGAGEQTFIHADVPISATDTHYADYGAWDGSSSMTLHVDHGSDGTIDETTELNNQAWRVYLPLILRNR